MGLRAGPEDKTKHSLSLIHRNVVVSLRCPKELY